MNFLSEVLSRFRYNARISYVDTLSLSRKYIKGLKNYKQDTVVNFFELHNKNSHRAENDAEICGNILGNILDIIEAEQKKKMVNMEKSKASPAELEVCAAIQSIIAS